jgi:hypothetical protein
MDNNGMEQNIDYEMQLENALRSVDPAENLNRVTIEFYEHSHQKEEILIRLRQFMLMLRSLGREKDEDLILDYYDFLIGYTADKPPF